MGKQVNNSDTITEKLRNQMAEYESQLTVGVRVYRQERRRG